VDSEVIFTCPPPHGETNALGRIWFRMPLN
jgi:hypothetical protein